MFAIGAFSCCQKPNYFPELFTRHLGNFATVYWPILLIVAGLFFLLSLVFLKNGLNVATIGIKRKLCFERNETISTTKMWFLGMLSISFWTKNFREVEINAVFEGVTLDLRKTKLAEGDTLLK